MALGGEDVGRGTDGGETGTGWKAPGGTGAGPPGWDRDGPGGAGAGRGPPGLGAARACASTPCVLAAAGERRGARRGAGCFRRKKGVLSNFWSSPTFYRRGR